MRRLILIIFALSAGCTGSLPIDHEEHEFDDPSAVDLGADPWRARRRMDIDQLDASIRAVTGGIGWDRGSADARVSKFDDYAETLGVPDYINSSSEDLSVSLLFAKFLSDAARDVCGRLVDREAGDPGPYDGEAQGIFAPVDVDAAAPSHADVDAALSSLLLRFHGRRVPADSSVLQPWRDLHARIAATSAATDEPRLAWEGVCVALITHPDFYTY